MIYYSSLNEVIRYDASHHPNIVCSFIINKKTKYNKKQSMSFLGPKIWSIISAGMKNATSFLEFKKTTENGNQLPVYNTDIVMTYLYQF